MIMMWGSGFSIGLALEAVALRQWRTAAMYFVFAMMMLVIALKAPPEQM